ncbi:hypothetical protein JCM3774_000312 [Rhodotorula dairenensis]
MAAFAMSTPNLTIPAKELGDWRIIQDIPTGPEHTASTPVSEGGSDSDLKGPLGGRTREHSEPIDEHTRQASRAEALAKLTTPTPTAADIFRELDAFPFPVVGAAPDAADITTAVRVALRTERAVSLSLPRPLSGPAGKPVPPPLVRANTVDAQPNPIPLDIDLRGRLVRARNAPMVSSSPGLTISTTSSASPGLSSLGWPESRGSRESCASTASTSDESFPLRQAGVLYAVEGKGAAESAIDVPAVVEEDVATFAGPRLRPRTALKRRSTQKAKRALPVSDRMPDDAPEGSLELPSLQDRRVARTQPPRPCRLALMERSFSSGLVLEPTLAERDQVSVPSCGADVAVAATAAPERAQPTVEPVPARPPGQQRCFSDPVLEGLPPRMDDGVRAFTPARSRHESYGVAGAGNPPVERYHDPVRRWSATPAVRTKLVVRELGKPPVTYQLGECIGRGQFGSVYRALNLNTGQVVAVKRIALEGRTKGEINELSNEVMLLQKLSHPAVVKYEGVVRTEHYLNIVLEYVENGSLQQTLRQFGQLPEGLVAAYVAKILEGLSYLHTQGVVHCDLKAANVLSTKNGNVKLSDFGVSLNIHAIKTTRGLATAANNVTGTPNWMAPEVISMEGATPASDIWSLAATVCELISGHPPYHDLVAMSAMFRIVEDEMPPLPESASRGLQAFLRRCFDKDPKRRPTAQALFSDPWLLAHSRYTQQVRTPLHARKQ